MQNKTQNLSIAVITTFPNHSWEIYSKIMLKNFVAYWPKEVPIMAQLDDDLLERDVRKILRNQDGAVFGWTKEHADFVERNKSKDDPNNYRKQAVRFCHKIFAVKFAMEAAKKAREAKADDAPRYLVWMDADVITTKPVSFEDLAACMPRIGDAVAYLGRKDWDHSECGWLVFDLENGGDAVIDNIYGMYLRDEIFEYQQWHDSFIWDSCLVNVAKTNLTDGKPGMEIWKNSPMAKFSTHHKGPVAKETLAPQKPKGGQPIKIQTKNSIPDEAIQRNILENQTQIKNWVVTCKETDEEIVVVSAGPMLVAEDLMDEVKAGRKIIAVKHALKPLKDAGIKPWACILLDPRDHVYDFVNNPDTEIIWFVASQVVPKAVKTLLDAGCKVYGYHAAVGAGEKEFTEKQFDSVVHGGSATATRGLYLLDKLGFRNFRLYGYELSFGDKPDLSEKDENGQPKYWEVSIEARKDHYYAKRAFWSKGELLAQYQEIVDIIGKMNWHVRAFGHGIVPFLMEADRISNLREQHKRDKIGFKPISYEEFLGCRKTNSFLTRLPKTLQKILRRQKAETSF